MTATDGRDMMLGDSRFNDVFECTIDFFDGVFDGVFDRELTFR